MALKPDTKEIGCDFCDASIAQDIFNKGGNSWKWGRRGEIFPTGAVCMLVSIIKYSCPDYLCQAKLLVWTRT